MDKTIKTFITLVSPPCITWVQYRGGYCKCGGYLEYLGGIALSTVGDIMMHVGDIMSTMVGVQYHGGYHPL